MNYEQKYKNALERAKKLAIDGYLDAIAIDDIFPELKESEDELTWLKTFIEEEAYYQSMDIRDEADRKRLIKLQNVLAWLEKQDECKPITWSEEDEKIMKSALWHISNSVSNGKTKEVDCQMTRWVKSLKSRLNNGVTLHSNKPKFEVGDWLQYRYAEPFLVEEITKQGYCNGDSCLPFEWEDEIHLWTIQDAKDGDVLATEDGRPFIIRCMVESKNDIPSAYCGINARPIEAFIITGYSPGTSKWTNSKVHPATKEQRDLLFQKMKEAGYEWDTEKKEVKKIEPKMLDADKVIEWIDRNAAMFWESPCNPSRIVEQFKKDLL